MGVIGPVQSHYHEGSPESRECDEGTTDWKATVQMSSPRPEAWWTQPPKS